jgi:acetyl-CoA synthetase (ADP-forming)
METKHVTLHTAHRTTPGAAPRIPVDRMLHPRSVAVFGASEDIGKFGGRIIHFLVKHGFAGDVYPINPNRAEIAGRKAYPRIADVPSPPDVAILAVPMARMLESIEQAAAAGVGCCVIITTGFAEVDADGAERQAKLVELTAKTGMRIVGPNCMGFIVPHHHMALCSSVVLNSDALGDGAIGLISQSGGLMVSVFDRAKTDGIGLRYGVSLGNQVDLEICDFLEFMIEDPGTKAICLYVEGLLDGARFQKAAAACRRAGKPLLVLKTGRTQAGIVAAKSHTASLAGSWEAFEAVCREQAVIIVRDPDDMLRAAQALIENPAPRAGSGLAVISSSGGGTSTASDRVVEMGLELAPLTAETRRGLGEFLLPPQARNPIDLGARAVPADVEIAGPATSLLLADPTVDLGVALLMSMPFYQKRAVAVAEAARASGKPVLIVCTPGAAANAAREEMRAKGFVVYDSFEQALRILCLITEYDRLRRIGRDAPVRPAGLPSPTALASLAAGAQTESEVKKLLATYGVTVAREEIAATPDAAAAAAGRVGFPVVLKAVSREIVHKSDVGGVRVGLADAVAVKAAAGEMAQKIGAAMPGVKLEGFSVQEMARGDAEVIVGVRRDEQFGPIVIVGLGGIAVEILNDVAVATAPVSASRVREMLATLKTAPLFQGARGKPPLDIAAIADAVERMSWLAHDLGERLVDLEVNPLIVRGNAGGAVAVDGRATFKE